MTAYTGFRSNLLPHGGEFQRPRRRPSQARLRKHPSQVAAGACPWRMAIGIMQQDGINNRLLDLRYTPRHDAESQPQLKKEQQPLDEKLETKESNSKQTNPLKRKFLEVRDTSQQYPSKRRGEEIKTENSEGATTTTTNVKEVKVEPGESKKPEGPKEQEFNVKTNAVAAVIRSGGGVVSLTPTAKKYAEQLVDFYPDAVLIVQTVEGSSEHCRNKIKVRPASNENPFANTCTSEKDGESSMLDVEISSLLSDEQLLQDCDEYGDPALEDQVVYRDSSAHFQKKEPALDQWTTSYLQKPNEPPAIDILLAHMESNSDQATWTDLWEYCVHEEMCRDLEKNSPGRYLPIFEGSKRWNAVKDCFDDGDIKITEDNQKQRLCITKIEKVHNPYLDYRYKSFCDGLAYKPNFSNVNERWLFHGTSKNSPDGICLGTAGFDSRVCKESNFIGRSIHFSLRANVCAMYYPHRLLTEKKSQILLARVACGNLCSVSSFKGRVRPPAMRRGPANVLYDSVMCRTKTFVDEEPSSFVGVFDPHQSMPDYLITYEHKDVVPTQQPASSISS